MSKQQDGLIQQIQNSRDSSVAQSMLLVLKLSIPAILAQISSIAMQYIDAAMVGSLGASASASIGLVSSSTWLFGGICMATGAGFSVQVAHAVGAGNEKRARQILKQGLLTGAAMGLLLGVIGLVISPYLPIWLGGKPEVLADATGYFRIFSLALPFEILLYLSGNMLQCSGDMRTPSVLNILLCVLDVIFNAIFIFPSQTIHVLGMNLQFYGVGMGVRGAALGTAVSEVIIAALMLGAVTWRSPILRIRPEEEFRFDRGIWVKALKIAAPMAAETAVMNGAQIASTRIVAPLGTVSVAANSLAVTAESLCYMPGYGIGSAATTLVGQCLGAKEKELAKKYAYLSVLLGVIWMTVMGVLMFLSADFLFMTLTQDPAVRSLGASVLRIEAFAEPLFATSICTTGVLRGAGDTLVPSIMNLLSMWGVRIVLSLFLAPVFGLSGVWIAMAVELSVRGILYLIRLFRGKWLDDRKTAVA